MKNIYIVLTYTGTALARLIKIYTKKKITEELKINYIDKTNNYDIYEYIEDIEISNIKITNIRENKCMLTATIKNNSEEYM